jgi:hypothetical protein
MAIKYLLGINMCLLGILGFSWSKSHWLNFILKIILMMLAIANLLALMRIEGYIIEIAK